MEGAYPLSEREASALDALELRVDEWAPCSVTPRVVIVLAIEGAPVVHVETAGGSEPSRLLDWVLANPEFADLVHHAVQLQVESERRFGRAG